MFQTYGLAGEQFGRITAHLPLTMGFLAQVPRVPSDPELRPLLDGVDRVLPQFSAVSQSGVERIRDALIEGRFTGPLTLGVIDPVKWREVVRLTPIQPGSSLARIEIDETALFVVLDGVHRVLAMREAVQGRYRETLTQIPALLVFPRSLDELVRLRCDMQKKMRASDTAAGRGRLQPVR
jgi:hypothetical protein